MAWTSTHTRGFNSCFPSISGSLYIGLIVIICHCSQSIAKRLGQNPVAVLATLLLMSYSKILGAVIVPLTSTWTYLTYYTKSNETKRVVWMYDASVPYFGESGHTALGLFAILCIVRTSICFTIHPPTALWPLASKLL